MRLPVPRPVTRLLPATPVGAGSALEWTRLENVTGQRGSLKTQDLALPLGTARVERVEGDLPATPRVKPTWDLPGQP